MPLASWHHHVPTTRPSKVMMLSRTTTSILSQVVDLSLSSSPHHPSFLNDLKKTLIFSLLHLGGFQTLVDLSLLRVTHSTLEELVAMERQPDEVSLLSSGASDICSTNSSHSWRLTVTAGPIYPKMSTGKNGMANTLTVRGSSAYLTSPMPGQSWSWMNLA